MYSVKKKHLELKEKRHKTMGMILIKTNFFNGKSGAIENKRMEILTH